MRKSVLNPRQEKFVAAYIANGGNAKQAAIAAGYSAKTATVQGSRLLTDANVRAEINKRRAKLADKFAVTQERITAEYAKLGFFDARKLFDANGNPLPINELDDDTAAALVGVDISVERTGERGGDFSTVRKYRLADKKGALDSLARTLGMFVDKVQLSGQVDIANVIAEARRRGAR